MSVTILTVDDSRAVRMIIKKAFKTYACDIYEAGNGVEGLAMAEKIQPDLILLDITMPVMDGVEMLTKLKSSRALKHIPVIMLTAESGKDNVMQIVKMGVKDYMVKPFRGEQLIERASAILNLKKRVDAPSILEDDAGPDFFSVDGQYVILAVPSKISRTVAAQVDGSLKQKIGQMKSCGTYKMIVDISKVAEVNMSAIQLIIAVVNSCVRAKIPSRLVASGSQAEMLKTFQETGSIDTQPSLEEAMGSF